MCIFAVSQYDAHACTSDHLRHALPPDLRYQKLIFEIMDATRTAPPVMLGCCVSTVTFPATRRNREVFLSPSEWRASRVQQLDWMTPDPWSVVPYMLTAWSLQSQFFKQDPCCSSSEDNVHHNVEWNCVAPPTREPKTPYQQTWRRTPFSSKQCLSSIPFHCFFISSKMASSCLTFLSTLLCTTYFSSKFVSSIIRGIIIETSYSNLPK